MERILSILLFFLIFQFQLNAQYWYSFGREMYQDLSADCTIHNTKLFPDSTVLVKINGDLRPVQIHGVGQVLDPKSELFELCECEVLEESQSYYVDSIGFWYTYQRAQINPDTLIIQFFKQDNITLIEHPWPDWDGMEDVSRARLSYDTSLSRSPEPNLEIVEILDDDDITFPPLSKFKKFYIGEYVPPGEVVAATVTYIPGNPYSPGDTLEFDEGQVNQLNQFTMRHYNDYEQLFINGHYNHGFMAHTCVRYHTCTEWENEYISGNAWGGEGGRFFHADLRFFLSGPSKIAEENIKDIEIFPNPVFNQLTIDISGLDMQMNVVDIFGLNGERIAGSDISNSGIDHKIDVSQLNGGIYLLKIIGENSIFHAKFIKQ